MVREIANVILAGITYTVPQVAWMRAGLRAGRTRAQMRALAPDAIGRGLANDAWAALRRETRVSDLLGAELLQGAANRRIASARVPVRTVSGTRAPFLVTANVNALTPQGVIYRNQLLDGLITEADYDRLIFGESKPRVMKVGFTLPPTQEELLARYEEIIRKSDPFYPEPLSIDQVTAQSIIAQRPIRVA